MLFRSGASVGLLLLWTRRVEEKFDGAMGNYLVYVSFDVWMINTSRCFKCLLKGKNVEMTNQIK